MSARTTALIYVCLVPVLSIAHEDDPKSSHVSMKYIGSGCRQCDQTEQRGVRNFSNMFDSQRITLHSWLSLGDFEQAFGRNIENNNDIWGYTSSSGKEYAIVGTRVGTAFVDVSDPGDAHIVAVTNGPLSLWQDVKVYQDMAYIVSEAGGSIKVMDLSQIDQGIVTKVRNVTNVGTNRTHNIAVDESSGFLYRCGGGNEGLRIYDLTDPSDPKYVAFWSDKYVHDAQVVTYEDGRQIAFCCAGFNAGWRNPGLTILDVTDKQNIIELTHYEYPEAEYSHQGWLSPDGRYFYLGDELDEQEQGFSTNTRIIDVQDLTNPVLVGRFSNRTTAIDHNLYVKGDYIFQANYTSGLRVFDASDSLRPKEIAYFDTFPQNDAPTFNGMWSVYPYFDSGTIIANDMDRGLFVFSLGELPLQFHYPHGKPKLVMGAQQRFYVDITPLPGQDVDPDSVMLVVSIDDNTQSLRMSEYEPGRFVATFPILPCGQFFTYHVEARTTDDQLVQHPALSRKAFKAAALSSNAAVNLLERFDMEHDDGWLVSGDATAGHWELADPEGTVAQPKRDRSQDGDMCWVTDGRSGTDPGDFDVDGGATILESPALDLSATSAPVIVLSLWYDNSRIAYQEPVYRKDHLLLQLVSQGVVLEDLLTLHTAVGGWETLVFTPKSIPSEPVNLRLTVADRGRGNLVEAALDEVLIYDVDCGP